MRLRASSRFLGQRSFCRKIESIFAAASWRNSGMTCVYVFIVIAICE